MSNELNCNCGILFTELMDGRTDGFVPVKYRYGIAASVLYRWSGLRAQHSTPRSFGGNLTGFQLTDLPELSMLDLSMNSSGRCGADPKWKGPLRTGSLNYSLLVCSVACWCIGHGQVVRLWVIVAGW